MPELSKTPARLFVAMSKNPKKNIVLRRGPTRQVATFNWNADTGKVTLGQWLRGKIYDHRVDISPDGEHFIYLALGKHGKTWTAVSKTPWLKALDFYPWGSTWGGGGLFYDIKSYGLSGQCASEDWRQNSGLTLIDIEHIYKSNLPALNRTKSNSGYESSAYGLKLQRDGWTLHSTAKETGDHITRFAKPCGKKWLLVKLIGGKAKENQSAEHESHEIINIVSGEAKAFKDWEWADIKRNKVYWAEGGKLFAAKFDDTNGLRQKQMLHDFNSYMFENRTAPY